MTDETARREQRRAALVRRWRPSAAGARNGAADLGRWEEVLRAERSAGYRLAGLIARIPVLRRVLGAPRRLAIGYDGSLEEREARVADARASAFGRYMDDPHGRPPTADEPQGFPAIGPLLDDEIDASLGLLAAMPFEELQWRGWHLQENHFYVPLNDVPFLREHPELWTRGKVPGGIDWRLDEQVELLERLAAHADELDDVPDGPNSKPGQFFWDNDSLPRGDAYAYYGLVRELRPKRVIEIAGGWSSLLLGRAIAANDQTCEVTLIEPQLGEDALEGLPRGAEMIESPVQLVDLEVFEGLEAGDILFFDGSHCMRTGGDVNWVFFEVLPRLVPGVWIHVHDLFWPWDYPPTWVLDEGYSFNEQYLAQAFLMGNSAYRVRLAVSMLGTLRRPDLHRLLPGGAVGGSLWIEKRRRFVTGMGDRLAGEGRAVTAKRAAQAGWTVADVMRAREDCATEDMPIAQVALLLSAAGALEALPVIGAERLLGTIAPAALLRVLGEGDEAAGVTAGAVVHRAQGRARHPGIAPGAPVEEADAAMIVAGLDHLPVVESGRLVGVVSRAALAAYRYEAPDGFEIPPEDMLRRELPDAPRQALARSFVEGGARVAHAIRTVLREHGRPLDECDAVLELGCGPGRVIRHFGHLPYTRLYGCDADAEAIAWCRDALPFAEFVVAGPEPVLDYADECFDVVYTVSAEEWSRPWLAELQRVAKRGGVVLLVAPGEPAEEIVLLEDPR